MQLSKFTYDKYSQIDELLGGDNLVSRGYFTTLRFMMSDKHNRYLSTENIEQNTNYFFHHLNSRLFGRAYSKRRRTKPRSKLQHITVCHKHKTNIFQSHIHSIILRPLNTTHNQFVDRIHTSWGKTLFGYVGDDNHGVDVQKIYSRGVIPYLFNEQGYYDSLAIGLSL